MRSFRPLLCFLFLIINTLSSYGWGFWGHKKINRIAVFTLPPEMVGFYKTNIEYLSSHAVDADKRRYAVKEEGARHYIDIDHYGKHAIDSMPRYWNDAVKKYTEDTLMAYGINPWHVQRMKYRLTEAFKEKDFAKILKYSADIGHYIGDAHVPLHTSENYNGQLTGQHGIHGLWESRLPELFGEQYDFFVGQASYINKTNDKAWEIIKKSHSLVDSVLLIEARITKTIGSDKKYSLEQKGGTTQKVYSEEYSKLYSLQLNNMVEQRMRDAILAVGSFWYTAWVDAGQPDLNNATKEIIEEMPIEEPVLGGNLKEKGHVD